MKRRLILTLPEVTEILTQHLRNVGEIKSNEVEVQFLDSADAGSDGQIEVSAVSVVEEVKLP